ncbi:MAG: hypothetical protein ABDH49_07005 [Candidatus Hydrothermales bacterium]
MRFDIKAEILFFVGTILFMFSLFYFSSILSRMLTLLKKPKFLSIFPLIGAFFLFLVSLIHFYKIIFVYPRLKVAGFELFEIILSSFQLSFFENLFFLIGAFFSFLATSIYLYWVSK